MLRNEIARLVGHTKKLEHDLRLTAEDMSQDNAMLRAENMKLKKGQLISQEPHTPQSQNSLWAQRKKREGKGMTNQPKGSDARQTTEVSRISDRIVHKTLCVFDQIAVF